jgi:hypothetical protein
VRVVGLAANLRELYREHHGELAHAVGERARAVVERVSDALEAAGIDKLRGHAANVR